MIAPGTVSDDSNYSKYVFGYIGSNEADQLQNLLNTHGSKINVLELQDAR